MIVSAPLSARPGLRWCPVQVVRAVLVCYLFIYLFIIYYLSIYLIIIYYIYIYILYILYTSKAIKRGAAAGLLWRRLAAREMTGRGRAGRCADLCGVSGDAVRADPWTFAAFRALASLSWWFAGGVLLLLACCGCRQSGPVPGALPYNIYNNII